MQILFHSCICPHNWRLMRGYLSLFTGFHSEMDSNIGKPKSEPKKDLSVTRDLSLPDDSSKVASSRR